MSTMRSEPNWGFISMLLLVLALPMDSEDCIKQLAILLARRERAVLGHLLVESDDLGIARQLPDSGLHLFSGERGWIAGHEFFELIGEPRVLKGLNHGPAQGIYDLRRSTRRQDIRPTRVEKRAE